MDKELHRAMKTQLVACMQEDHSWRKAVAQTGIQISRSVAYRLCQKVREQGERALQDGRHGHPIKLRGEARTFLEDSCREAPRTPSSVIQTLLHERFAVSVSISQINRVRAALGVSNHPQSPVPGKKRQEKSSLPLKQNGRKVPAVGFYSPLPIKPTSSRSFKQPSHQASSKLRQRCVWRASNPKRYAARC
jgi:transposase